MRIQPASYINLNNNTSNPNGVSVNNAKSEPSFNGIASRYGEWILKSKGVRNFSKKLYSRDTTNATKHFAVVGSFITSTAYAYNTLKNKNFEKKNSTTLAINQSLGFLVPTFLAYTLDKLLAGYTREIEHSFAAKIEKALRTANLTHEQYEVALERATKQIKGVKTLASISTFVFLYRYLAPVAITKPANRIGEWVGKKVDENKQRKAELGIQTA